jgi:hypothetical protein
MRTQRTTTQSKSESPSPEWTEAEIEQFCWDAGVLTQVSVYGFRKAATDAFLGHGYQLATITRDFNPFDYIHKLSLYVLGDRPRLGRQEMKRLARKTMKEIGCPVKADECIADISGRRAVVSVALPRWAWPKL